jgi:hypothetical protein
LQIHQVERFLHVLDMDRARHNQPVAMAHQNAQAHYVLGRPERRPQQTIAVQLLNELTVQNVALAAG